MPTAGLNENPVAPAPPARRLAVLAAAVLAIAAFTAAVGAIHARLYGHDIFFLLDNGWRALHGQRVHADYSSAFGPLTFLLVAAGLALSGASVAAVSYANALATLVTGVWAAWLAQARSRTLTAVAYAVFVALLAAAPFTLGEAPIWTSHGMVYNRYGYALLAVLMLECFVPAISASRRRLIAEPLLTGCAAGLLLFLKVTYFLAALPLLAVSLLLWEDRARRLSAYAAGFAATSLAFLAYLRFDLAAMWSDLAMAAAARSSSLAWRYGFGEVIAGVLVRWIPLGALAFLCDRLLRRGGDPWWRAHRLLLAAAAVAAVDAFLLVSNAQSFTCPLMAAFALLLLFPVGPALRSARWAPGLILLAALLAGPPLVLNSVGLGYALYQSRFHPNPPGVLRFDSPRLRPLVLYDVAPGDIDRDSNGRPYVASVNDGMRLLAANTRPSDPIATLDMFNPFAYALARPPMHGGMAAAAYRYFLDDRHHPSPERFFGDATVVMVPKHPASLPLTYDGYRRIYQPALERNFHLAAESSYWWLYRK